MLFEKRYSKVLICPMIIVCLQEARVVILSSRVHRMASKLLLEMASFSRRAKDVVNAMM